MQHFTVSNAKFFELKRRKTFFIYLNPALKGKKRKKEKNLPSFKSCFRNVERKDKFPYEAFLQVKKAPDIFSVNTCGTELRQEKTLRSKKGSREGKFLLYYKNKGKDGVYISATSFLIIDLCKTGKGEAVLKS